MFQVAAEVAAPLSQVKKVTMISTGTGEVGAAKLTGEVLSIVSKVPEIVKNLTGVDIVKVCACGNPLIFLYLQIHFNALSTIIN